MDTTVAHFGGIDIVLDNAANEPAQPVGEITPAAGSFMTGRIAGIDGGPTVQ
ncbi:hypothetical protein ACIBSV_27490 [Embleya sp. NPDC050154]|uniref:hypothetical protein n=1 Tax=unclassified Embleya TaxID=2699296 RepID=UPI0037AFB313